MHVIRDSFRIPGAICLSNQRDPAVSEIRLIWIDGNENDRCIVLGSRRRRTRSERSDVADDADRKPAPTCDDKFLYKLDCSN